MEALGRLAGGVAHDFNNLLMIIKGYSELALGHANGDDRLRAMMDKIKQAGEKGSRLTRQLLSLSRRQVMEQGVLDLNHLVAGMGDLFRPLIPENVSLATVLADDLWPVRADAGQVEQVVMNLVVNALDAMADGGRLTIETGNKEVRSNQLSQIIELPPGRYAMIAISDTGLGMDQQTLSHIFEPFYTTKEPGKGTGLGLSVVYGIVKQIGGGLSVYSEPGQGTAFKIYLPRAEDASAAKEALRSDTSRARNWETVLLVEDDEGVRSLVAESLRLTGYQVLEAGQGEQALALVASHQGPLHLVISDMVMPGLSGPHLVRQLKGLRPEAEVLFISGYTEAAIAQADLQLAANRFLQKPFSMDELECKIREILS
jgi:CheY-like chemotaxis protein